MAQETASLSQALAVSEKLSPADQLRLISILSDRLGIELESETESVDMLSLAGVGAEIWEEIDVEAYLDEERASWQR